MRYSQVWPVYRSQWDKMQIKPSRKAEFNKIAARIFANKARYQTIERKTGVPWELIGLLHTREGNGDFGTYLGNGQSLRRRTTIVPKGRGPFKTFEDGAVDALKLDGLSDVKDWRLEKMLYWATGFNGWGYWPKPSPYIWGGSNIQVPGKYTSDHHFDPGAWDTQPGVAPILATLAKMDPTIPIVRET